MQLRPNTHSKGRRPITMMFDEYARQAVSEQNTSGRGQQGCQGVDTNRGGAMSRWPEKE